MTEPHHVAGEATVTVIVVDDVAEHTTVTGGVGRVVVTVALDILKKYTAKTNICYEKSNRQFLQG